MVSINLRNSVESLRYEGRFIMSVLRCALPWKAFSIGGQFNSCITSDSACMHGRVCMREGFRDVL